MPTETEFHSLLERYRRVGVAAQAVVDGARASGNDQAPLCAVEPHLNPPLAPGARRHAPANRLRDHVGELGRGGLEHDPVGTVAQNRAWQPPPSDEPLDPRRVFCAPTHQDFRPYLT